jgi:2-amino-4-hydroxy-6-hydroxymethyldihydropteridine diphosphokinase
MSEENASNRAFSSYAFISIGANLPSANGSPADTIALAFDCIARLPSSGFLKSSLYSSTPVDSPAGTPDFLNAVAGIIPDDTETPLSLLHKLQAIENEAGRTRSGLKNEARILDLDLIVFGAVVCDTPELIVPHPRAQERRFVLEPLKEIAGEDFVLPGLSESLQGLLLAIGDQQGIYKARL